MKKSLIFISVVVLLVIVAALFKIFSDFSLSPRYFVSQVSPGPNEAVFFPSPETGTYGLSANFAVDLKISSTAGITSVKAYLNFPASTLNVVSIDTSGSSFGNFWENTYNNTTGKIQLQASTPTPGFSGTGGIVARINFRTVAAGTAAITYDSGSLALKPDDSNVLNLSRSLGANFTVDITPPVRSNGQPSGTLAAGTTQTTISLSTNESATCKYSTVAGTAYNSMSGSFSTTGGTSHSTLVTGLTNGSSYTYYVRCIDSAGNANTDDSFSVSFSIGTPNRAPVLNAIGNKSVNENSTLQFTISGSDPDGDTLTYSASNLPSGASFNSTSRTFSWIPAYSQAGTYSNVRFQVSDGSLTAFENITITVNNVPCTNCNLVSPVITPSSPMASQSYTITCPSTLSGNDCISAYVDSILCTFSSWSGSNAIFNCPTFASAGSHVAKCESKEGTGFNCCADNTTNPFNVISPDITPPVRSNGQPSGTLAAGTTQTTISLSTNESATCKYSTVAGTAYNSMSGSFSTTGGTSHSTLVTGLTNGSSYTYYVKCIDLSANANTDDFTISFNIAWPQFTVSDVNPLYLFKDKASNVLSVAGSNFSLSQNFSFKFMTGTTANTTLNYQPQTVTNFSVTITSSQLNVLAVGYYDLKIERAADAFSQTYSQKILVTVLGDVSGTTPGVRDGKVNIYDLSRMMSKWNSTNVSDLAEADINTGPGGISSGKIDLYDANKMMANWLP